MSIYRPGRPNKYNPTTDSGQKPPKQPGEYRIRNSKGEILYIGETNNLNRRMHEHINSGKLGKGTDNMCTIEYKTADRRSTSRTRREHEREKIAQHNPVLNRSIGGEGRIAARW